MLQHRLAESLKADLGLGSFGEEQNRNEFEY